ncbi:MAG: PorT family protein [Bacteroidales bacterium]|nr:PorT family protein [Bacteroidales bacterium]
MRLIHRTIISLFLLLTFLSVETYAQRNSVQNLPRRDYEKIHFGFVLGANQMFFSIKPYNNFSQIVYDSTYKFDPIICDSLKIYSIESTPTYGFTVGIVSNLRLGKYFDLRFVPSLLFGERYIEYTFHCYKDNKQIDEDFKTNISSTFISLPFTLKYKSKRLNNLRGYVFSGVNFVIDLASNAKKKQNNEDIQIRLKKNDMMLEFGAGFDFYTPFFKFGTEIKIGYGMNDILIRERNVFSAGIDRMNSKIFQLSFTFE